MSYHDINLRERPSFSFRVRTALRRSGIGRWAYRRRWNRLGDVFLLSFPKAGRTWLRVLLARALADQYQIPWPGLIDLRKLADEDPRVPRIICRHDDNPHIKTVEELVTDKGEYRDRKVILMVRDLRDLAVSTYFQMTRREHRFDGDIGEFIRLPRGGVRTAVRFYNIWADSRDVPADFALVRYEDLHADPPGELRRLLAFVGVEQPSEQAIGEAVQFARFENMRALESAGTLGRHWLSPMQTADPESYKTRRGKVGGYTDYLAPEDVAWIDALVRDELSSFYGYPLAPDPPPAVGRE